MFDEDAVLPQYGSASFAELPQTVRYLLTGQGGPGLALPAELDRRWQKVVLCFIDAFGWRFCQSRLDDYPFLRRFGEQGLVKKITSQFPSTTAAHVTCIHTGLTPGQSGVFEWQYYEPLVDRIIMPLLFSPVGTRLRNALEDVEPEEILPIGTIYRELEEAGVRSYAFQPALHLISPYARLTYDGAEVVPYRTLSEGLVSLKECLRAESEPSYFFFYFDGIDQVGHTQGPGSAHIDAEIDAFLTVADRVLGAGDGDDTLLMVVADHGMMEVDPKTTIYLNLHPDFAGVERFLRRNNNDELLVPAGSCRDMFLYINEGRLEEAQAFFEMRLQGRVDVVRADELVRRGLFGPTPTSEAFDSHVGDLVLLPKRGESVWWYERGKFEQEHFGAHGGLSAQEMEVPFLVRPY
jgi:predicted AlkP superfamily pyrophosphatase or phosphodiesterase